MDQNMMRKNNHNRNKNLLNEGNRNQIYVN